MRSLRSSGSTRLRRLSNSVVAATLPLLAACSMSDLVNTELPSTSTNPDAVNTPQGAVDRYKASIQQFRASFSGYSTNAYIWVNALFSDEMGSGQYNIPSQGGYTPMSLIDSRSVTENVDNSSLTTMQVSPWSGLSATRLVAQDAIYALTMFAPQSPKDRIGHAYALQGMAEVLLSELYCSGIPLTTLNPKGGFTYGRALTTEQILEHAIAQFDTAMSFITDSSDYLNFARVGRGRALLNLGRFNEARDAVRDVPTSFEYRNLHSLEPAGAVGVANFTANSQPGSYGVLVDREGQNGLDYLSANDPRVLYTDTTWPSSSYPDTRIVLPNKLMKPTSANPVVVASGIEARLIEAEAALRANDPSWLTILNTLRTTCTDPATCPSPAPAGTGGVAGLGVLTNPLTQDARVDLLFRERAFWLFLTGHRTGDMRRLIRQYGRDRESVFPVGPYPAGPVGTYGNDVNLPAPQTEIANNPLYNGCINRDA